MILVLKSKSTAPLRPLQFFSWALYIVVNFLQSSITCIMQSKSTVSTCVYLVYHYDYASCFLVQLCMKPFWLVVVLGCQLRSRLEEFVLKRRVQIREYGNNTRVLLVNSRPHLRYLKTVYM